MQIALAIAFSVVVLTVIAVLLRRHPSDRLVLKYIRQAAESITNGAPHHRAKAIKQRAAKALHELGKVVSEEKLERAFRRHRRG